MKRFYFILLKFFILIFALPISLIGISQAGEIKSSPIAILELFTSQGCASCPAADKLLNELGQRKDIIALAYHVDYWDFIGWKDSFASKENSNLQRNYARAQKANHIYTPQLIINGIKDVVGSDSDKINQALSNAKLSIPIKLKYMDDYIEISIPNDEKFSEAMIWLVSLNSSKEVEITRGENSGKIFTYTNIVNHRRALGMWNPKLGAHIKLPMLETLTADNDGFAIILQQDINGLPGRILGASSYFR